MSQQLVRYINFGIDPQAPQKPDHGRRLYLLPNGDFATIDDAGVVTPLATDWDSITGKPSVFPPSSHAHPTSEVTGLDQNLADLEAADLALGQRIDFLADNLDPVETDAIAHYADRSDFPTTGRLKRLYVQQNSGVIWAWTGTTYQKTSPTTDEFAALQGEVDLAETAIVTERTSRQAAIAAESSARQSADSALSANINALSESISSSDSAIAALDGRVSTNETAISTTLPGLIADAEGFIQHNTYSDFPPTGRLNRLYLDKSNGTLWRWTGTTYSPVPGEQDGGTY